VTRDETLLYLSSAAVASACRDLDPVAVVASALVVHARGETVLPDESYLAWEAEPGSSARSIGMAAHLGGAEPAAGVKVINANPANVARGLPRASGLTLLFDPDTARPLCVMEGARLSALRTAAVTALSIELLAKRRVERLAVIGAGALAEAHLDLLVPRLRDLRELRLHDLAPERAEDLRARHGAEMPEVRIELTSSPEEAIRGADVVVPVTTAEVGYIRFAWLAPGALLVNVSLDDVLPEVVLRVDKLFVDDWRLVSTDRRRLLGKMARAGLVAGPDSSGTRSRRVDGELGELLVGTKERRSSDSETVLVNPFGLAVADVAMAAEVYRVARRQALGLELDR